MDPSTEETMSILASFMGWLAMGLLLTLGGHRQVIDSCLESCTVYPAGGVIPEAHWLKELDDLMQIRCVWVFAPLLLAVGTALLAGQLAHSASRARYRS